MFPNFFSVQFSVINEFTPYLLFRCEAAITEEEKSQLMASSYETLIQARKENVGLQVEAAYRERLQEAFQQVSY